VRKKGGKGGRFGTDLEVLLELDREDGRHLDSLSVPLPHPPNSFSQASAIILCKCDTNSPIHIAGTLHQLHSACPVQG